MDYMTKLDGVPSTDDAIPGMAFFAGTGPSGKTCGQCKHRGLTRTSAKATFSVAPAGFRPQDLSHVAVLDVQAPEWTTRRDREPCQSMLQIFRAKEVSRPMTEPTAEKDDLVERLRCHAPGLGFDACQDCDGLIQDEAAAEIEQLRSHLASMRTALNGIAPAVESLARHQVQCDVDGVMVQVSRQAVDEVVSAINAIAIGPLAASATPGSAGENIRWAINVLLEQIAAKLEANETMDIWRSDAAATVRSFKHDLAALSPSHKEGK